MTREETAQLVAMMKAAWPNHPTPEPEAVVAAYWIGLDDVPADAATASFRRHLKDPQRGRFFPTVADLRGGLPVSPALALPKGKPTDEPRRWLYRVWDCDLDDYRELVEAVPDTDPWYAVELAASRERLRSMER